MGKSFLRGAAVVVTAGAMLAVGTSSALASAHSPTVVEVVGNGHEVFLDRSTVPAGLVRFRLSSSVDPGTTGATSSIVMIKLKGDATLQRLISDANDEFSTDLATAAKGTRELKGDATFFGLADPMKDHPSVVTETLAPGRYWIIDGIPTSPSAFHPFDVVGGDDSGDDSADAAPTSSVTVKMTSADQFDVSRKNWPHDATVTVRNVSDTLHFMGMSPVQPGTTDEAVTKALDGTGPSPFISGPTASSEVQSPGRTLQFTFDLPAGTYVLLCFVADEQTGMPHALMGMHKVVVVR